MAILSKNRNHARQFPLVADQAFTLAELTNGSSIAAVKIPANARVISGFVLVTEVFNTSGTGDADVLDVGDGGDVDRYSATPINLQALGVTALDVTGYKYTESDYIDLTWTGSVSSGDLTPATTGAGRLVVTYIIEGRTNELNPDYD